MSEQIEYELVQVRVPKAIMDMLRDFVDDPEEYLSVNIIASIKADIEADFCSDGKGAIISYEKFLKRYGLDKVFNDC